MPGDSMLMQRLSKKSWPIKEHPYGPVLIMKGAHAGRIGDYDDDGDDPFRGVVYFGGMFQSRGYYLIDKRYFKQPTISDLFTRHQSIQQEVFDILWAPQRPKSHAYRHLCSILAESQYVYTVLEERNLKGKYGTTAKGKSVYLAHSSRDKGLARMVHDDLKSLGHKPWLDEYAISVGESIIRKLEEGIAGCDYLMVFLSKSSENSEWVRVEWETKFWSEVERQKISVLPALLEDWVIPPLLARRKYADFRESYNEGLEQILSAIGHKQQRTTKDLLDSHKVQRNSL